MDAFKELIKIEEDFGPIHFSPQNQSKKRTGPTPESHQASLWSHITSSVLAAVPSKYQQFLAMIERSQIQKEVLDEIEKRKMLDEYLREKNVVKQKEKLK